MDISSKHIMVYCVCAAAERRTLLESAAAYTAAHRGRCLLKHIQVVTGEEQESNVVQVQSTSKLSHVVSTAVS